MSTIHLQWKNAPAMDRFRTGVSLHSHTLHSMESLDFIYKLARRNPFLAVAVRQGEREYQERKSAVLDFKQGWWTPPLGPHDVWLMEKSQIEALDRNAMVSITDHDNIEAPVSLQVLDDCAGTPISVEWTVPFGPTFFHLGIHNLPNSQARSLSAEMDAYRQNPDEAQLMDILEHLASLDQVLTVFNHPLWDERGIGKAAHRQVVLEFVQRFGPLVHALELNGMRQWAENRAVIELSRAVDIPLISGGDRHAVEANSLLNLTNAATFHEFVEEVRAGSSNVLVLRHYREPYALRIVHNIIDTLRTYERHANGWVLWSDRVFYRSPDGQVRSLTQLFGDRPPAAVSLFVNAMKFAAAPGFRKLLRGAFSGAEEVTL